jgi:hypothetical protein
VQFVHLRLFDPGVPLGNPRDLPIRHYGIQLRSESQIGEALLLHVTNSGSLSIALFRQRFITQISGSVNNVLLNGYMHSVEIQNRAPSSSLKHGSLQQ